MKAVYAEALQMVSDDCRQDALEAMLRGDFTESNRLSWDAYLYQQESQKLMGELTS